MIDLRVHIFVKYLTRKVGQFVEERQGPSSGFRIVGDSSDKQNSMSMGAISLLNDVPKVCAGFEVLIAYRDLAVVQSYCLSLHTCLSK